MEFEVDSFPHSFSPIMLIPHEESNDLSFFPIEKNENNSTILNLSDVLKQDNLIDLDSQKVNDFRSSNDCFIIFDIHLSPKEQDALNHIQITKDYGEYNRYAHLELIPEELPLFLEEYTTADKQEIETITNLVDRLSHQAVDIMGTETAWVTLRAFKENHDYDIHRWHADGLFFLSPSYSLETLQMKFATTLKGEGTLFYLISDELRAEYNAQYNYDRNYWHDTLDASNIISTHVGEGVLFAVGDPDRAAIHSEPPITQDRLFFSVVAGTYEQVHAREEWLIQFHNSN